MQWLSCDWCRYTVSWSFPHFAQRWTYTFRFIFWDKQWYYDWSFYYVQMSVKNCVFNKDWIELDRIQIVQQICLISVFVVFITIFMYIVTPDAFDSKVYLYELLPKIRLSKLISIKIDLLLLSSMFFKSFLQQWSVQFIYHKVTLPILKLFPLFINCQVCFLF